MFKELVLNTVSRGRIRWQRHALERMMERDIFRDDVKQVLLNGEMIEEYPDDHPFPSGLFFGIRNEIPLHVVAAVDKEGDWCYIVTVYKPGSQHFEPDFKTRKK